MYLFRPQYIQAIRNIPENVEAIKQMCGNKFIRLENGNTYVDTKNYYEFVPRGFYILKISKNHFYVMPDDVFEFLFIQEDKP